MRVGRHVLTPITVIRKWDGTSWLVWIVTDATVPSIGDAAWGGYMAGIIDTTRPGHRRRGPVAGRLRYLLIVSPKSIGTPPARVEDDRRRGAERDENAVGWAVRDRGDVRRRPEYEAATYCVGWRSPPTAAVTVSAREARVGGAVPEFQAHHGAALQRLRHEPGV